ncbi:MAG: YggS family pyridoxal phosphate-dependent enzyme [Verrucomicrobiota bacterium]
MTLESKYLEIQSKIEQACAKSGRSPEDVLLVGVTKTHPPETVEEALKLGILHIGENKVQEALAKKTIVGERGIWHMIGHLQSNKVKNAVSIFDRIDSVDSLALAEEISKRCETLGKTMTVLLEVNVSGEGTKYGVKPDQAQDLAQKVNDLPGLQLQGFMTMAPVMEDVRGTRPYFAKLRELRDRIQQATGFHLPDLSMGMSQDFEIAIEEGSTLIRLGTILFGSRPKPKKEFFEDSL